MSRRRVGGALLALALLLGAPSAAVVACGGGVAVTVARDREAGRIRHDDRVAAAPIACEPVMAAVVRIDGLLAADDIKGARAEVDAASRLLAPWTDLKDSPDVAAAEKAIKDRALCVTMFEDSGADAHDDAAAAELDETLSIYLELASGVDEVFRASGPMQKASEAVERRRKRLEPAVLRFERKQEQEQQQKQDEANAAAALLALCGTGPRVEPHGRGIIDVDVVVAQTAHDPGSVYTSNCSDPVMSDRCWRTTCIVRGKNAFGALVANTVTFYLGRDGAVLGMEEVQ